MNSGFVSVATVQLLTEKCSHLHWDQHLQLTDFPTGQSKADRDLQIRAVIQVNVYNSSFLEHKAQENGKLFFIYHHYNVQFYTSDSIYKMIILGTKHLLIYNHNSLYQQVIGRFHCGYTA